MLISVGEKLRVRDPRRGLRARWLLRGVGDNACQEHKALEDGQIRTKTLAVPLAPRVAASCRGNGTEGVESEHPWESGKSSVWPDLGWVWEVIWNSR